jgi:Tfp pilus assembly protein PilN
MERIKSLSPRTILLVLAVITVVTVGADVALYREAARHEAYYREKLEPIQQEIARQNKRCTEAKKRAEEFRKAPVATPPWSAKLVCLAETKPVGAALESLRLQNKRIILKGAAMDELSPRQWQERLERSTYFKSVGISKINRKKGRVEFELELDVTR